MNNEQIILADSMELRLPKIIMSRNNSASECDLRFEIIADEYGRIRKIYGKFGKDIKSAARILLRTMIRLGITPERALNVAKEFYLTAQRNVLLTHLKNQTRGLSAGNSSSNV